MDKKLYKLMDWSKIEEIVYSECHNPHEYLGPHKVGKDILVQLFYPGAMEAKVKMSESSKEYPMEMADEGGFFAFYT